MADPLLLLPCGDQRCAKFKQLRVANACHYARLSKFIRRVHMIYGIRRLPTGKNATRCGWALPYPPSHDR